MSRTSDRFVGEFYRDPSKYVLAIDEGGPKAYPFDQLKQQPLVHDDFNDEPIVIVFQPDSGTAWSYHREVDGQALEFELRDDGTLVDRQTGSQWNVARGQATTGKLTGKRLRPTLAIISYAKAWRVFHPDSRYWQADPK